MLSPEKAFDDALNVVQRGAQSSAASAVNKLAVRIGAWLTDAAARKAVADAALETVDQLGGALKRTLAALEPYLMQLHLEQR